MNPLLRMFRTSLIIGITLLAAACASMSSQSKPPKRGDLSGEWVLTTESQVGTEDAQMTVRQTGKVLAGTITGRAGQVDFTGSVQGSAVAFAFTMNLRDTDLKLDYSGIVEGDTMKGKAVFGQFGAGTFTAKRK
jgi:hypothetical protein